MIFSNNEYYHPMDREYAGNNSHEPKIEEPLFKVSEIGMTVTEGRGQGTFRVQEDSNYQHKWKEVTWVLAQKLTVQTHEKLSEN